MIIMKLPKIIRLTPEYEKNFYNFAAEYLPDSDHDRMKKYSEMYPKAFLLLLSDGQDPHSVGTESFSFPRTIPLSFAALR